MAGDANSSGLEKSFRGSGPVVGTDAFLSAIIESIVLLLLFRAAEILFFGNGYFSSLGQHPFWIVVFLAAIQHGLFTGVATAGLAALMMDWPPRPADVDITTHYLAVASLPLQWLGASLCVGLFRQTQIRDQQRSQAENGRLQEMNEALAVEVSRLDETVERLELESVTRGRPGTAVQSALASLGALQDASPDDLVQRFNEAAALCLSLPARLLVPSSRQGFAHTPDLPPLPGIDTTLHPQDLLVRRASSASSAVLASFEPHDGAPGREFIVSGVRVAGSRALAAVIVVGLEASDDPRAQDGETVRAVDLLASATALALARTVAGKPGEEGQLVRPAQMNQRGPEPSELHAGLTAIIPQIGPEVNGKRRSIIVDAVAAARAHRLERSRSDPSSRAR